MKANSRSRASKEAFTLPDLLMVVCTVACLLLALLAGHARTRSDNRGLACQSNLRRLTAAWLMYAADHNDVLVPNHHSGPSWVRGWLDWTSFSASENTNTVFLTDPRYAKLAPYANGGWQLYKCPADFSQVRWGPRVRSISMNAALGDGGDKTPYVLFFARKLSEVISPPPAMANVFLDEDPGSIQDGTFTIEAHTAASQYRWVALPGSFHEAAGSLSFADGHTELKPWKDQRTITGLGVIWPKYCGDSVDFEWLQKRTTIAPY